MRDDFAVLWRTELEGVLGMIGLADPEQVQQRIARTTERLAESPCAFRVTGGVEGHVQMAVIGDRLHPRREGSAAMKQPAVAVRVLHVRGAGR